MNTLLPLIAAALLTATGVPAAAADGRAPENAPIPTTGVGITYDKFTLPNGLTTIVYTDRSIPTVFVGLWYRTGSKDEPDGRTGFAHLFEHLMFQQTANRRTEFIAEMAKAGGTGMNGMTTIDYTSYVQTVPTNALDTALWLESDRMGYLDKGITQAILDEQRAVVQNEKRQQETPAMVEAQRRFDAAYYPPGHPYAHPTIGSMTDLNAATLADVRTWFTDHYGASNAVLVLAGDIDGKTAREKVSRYFGAIRAGRTLGGPRAWVPAQATPRRDVLYVDGAPTQLTRTWPVSNDDPRGVTMLLLAARTMTAVRESPFVKALVDEDKIASGVTARLNTNLLDSSFSIAMALRPGVDPARAGAALDAAIDRFAAAGPPPAALQSIRRGTNTAILRSLDDVTRVADFLGEGEVLHDDPAFFLKQRDWALAATSAQVGQAVRTWLTRPYYEQVTLPTPNGTNGGTPHDVDRTAIPVPGPLKTAFAMPPITEMRLSNGLRVVVAERPGIPLVDVAMQFDTGRDADPAYAPGAAAAAFGLMRSGTTTQTAPRLAEAMSRLNVPIAASAGDRTSEVAWSAGTARLDQAFALAADVIRHPAYPAAAIDEAVADTRRTLSAPRDPSAQATLLLANALRSDADPRGQTSGDQRLARDAVVRFHAREIGPGNATLLMAGDVTPARARALAERYFGDWRPNDPVRAAVAPPERAPQPRIVLIDAPGAAQSTVAVGALIPPYDKDRDAAEKLATAILADGATGRLNMNIRETRGWSYGFGGAIDGRPTGDRLFVAGGSIQADKTAEAMAEIRREIADIVGPRPIAPAELADVRDNAIRSVPLKLSGSPNLLTAMRTMTDYKLPYARIGGAADRLAGTTLDQTRAAATRLFAPDRLVWVVVGDLKTIEPAVRALGIAPVEVWDAAGKRVR